MATTFGQQVLDTQLSSKSKATAEVQLVDAMRPQAEDPVRPPVVAAPPRARVLGTEAIEDNRSPNNSFTNAQIDGALLQNVGIIEEQFQARAAGVKTVNDELIDNLVASAQDNSDESRAFIEQMRTLAPEEQSAAINAEIRRRRIADVDTRMLLLIEASRQGYGQSSNQLVDETQRALLPQEIQAKYTLWRDTRGAELRAAVDEIQATQDFTIAEGVGQAALADFPPLTPIFARMGLNDVFHETAGISVPWYKRILAGESRQVARNHFLTLSHEDQLQLIADTGQAIAKIQEGALGIFMNEYLTTETLMGLFPDTLLDRANPQDGVDRFLGNLDTALEALVLTKILAIGGRSVHRLMRSGDVSKTRAAAKAAGNNKLVAQHDSILAQIAERFGFTRGEAAAIHYPKPESFAPNREVLTDSTIDVLTKADAIESRILLAANEGVGDVLRVADRNNAIRQMSAELEETTGLKSHPGMATIAELDDGAGVRFATVLGENTDGGFKTLKEALVRVAEVDPQLAQVKVMRRSDAGNLQDLHLTDVEMGEILVKGNIPKRLVGHGGPGDFYVEITQDRFWHPSDKIGFNTESISSTVGVDLVLPPNRKFGSDIYDAVARSNLKDSYIRANFNQLYDPFFKLKAASQRSVGNYMEWGEEFARKEGKAPKIDDYIDHFPNMIAGELDAVVALRAGLDIQWSLFNRRLYRDLQTNGAVTVRPDKGTGARYHGKKVAREELNKEGTGALDPLSGEIVMLSRADVDDLYNGGGGIMRSDIDVDVPAGGKADLIIVRQGDYRYGKLSRQPLDHHDGYYPRFAKDPYVVVKVSKTQRVNGVTIRKGKDAAHEEAVKSAPNAGEAERAAASFTENSKDGTVYRAERVQKLDNTLGNLYQQQALQREGRLFWDQRNTQRLHSTRGGLMDLQDPVTSLHRNIRMATRATTHEDVLGALKTGLKNEFTDLRSLSAKNIAARSARDIVTDLQKSKNNAVGKAAKDRYRQAIRLAKYVRMIEGVDEVIVPALRSVLNSWAGALGRTMNAVPGLKAVANDTNFLRNIETWTARTDPLRFLRTQAFRAFMVLRPGRQAALQSMQVTFLTGLDPVYVGTGRVFKDMYHLRGEFNAIRNLKGDALSSLKRAKAMGITKAELKVLAREFERSGLMDSVSDHTFKGSSSQATKRPTNQTTARRAVGSVKDKVLDTAELGFNWGEKNNLTGAYMIAVRQHMRKAKLSKMTEIDKAGWKNIQIDSSNKALAMIRANNLPYQQGLFGVTTQFLSFTHKAGLAYFGQAAGLTGVRTAIKLGVGAWMIHGADIFGVQDFTRSQLSKLGVGAVMEQPHPEFGISLVDLIAGGMLETSIHLISRALSEDPELRHLEMESFAPGLNVKNIYEMMLEGVIDNPWAALAGPSGTLISAVTDAGRRVSFLYNDLSDVADVDKFANVANALAKGYFPAYNDVNMAWMGFKMGQWYTRSGEPIAIETTWRDLVARAAFGIRTEEELHLYDLNNVKYEDVANYRDIVNANRRFLKDMYAFRWEDKISEEQFKESMLALSAASEAWPEGQRHQILKDSMVLPGDGADVSVVKFIADHLASGQARTGNIFSKGLDDFLTHDYLAGITVEQRKELEAILIEQRKQLNYNDTLVIDKVKEENQ